MKFKGENIDMTLKTEDGKLIFTFDSTRWSLVQAYDTLDDVEKFSNSKLDFIGLLDGNKLFLIEVKNFRNRPLTAFDEIVRKLQLDQESRHDPKNQPIVKEMVDCVKDSLLFMTLHTRYDTTESVLWRELAALLADKKVEIVVVLCLEMDAAYLPKIDAQKLKLIKNTIEKRLLDAFYRLTKKVFILDSQSNSPFFKIDYQN
jgi:hypothetical protein